MLVLTRKPGQGIRIGREMIITVDEVRGHQVRLGIQAPVSIPVYREEIYQEMLKANRDSLVPQDLVGPVISLFGEEKK